MILTWDIDYGHQAILAELPPASTAQPIQKIWNLIWEIWTKEGWPPAAARTNMLKESRALRTQNLKHFRTGQGTEETKKMNKKQRSGPLCGTLHPVTGGANTVPQCMNWDSQTPWNIVFTIIFALIDYPHTSTTLIPLLNTLLYYPVFFKNVFWKEFKMPVRGEFTKFLALSWNFIDSFKRFKEIG